MWATFSARSKVAAHLLAPAAHCDTPGPAKHSMHTQFITHIWDLTTVCARVRGAEIFAVGDSFRGFSEMWSEDVCVVTRRPTIQ